MKILKCEKCGRYTLKDTCHGKVIRPVPAKYSPEDKYAKYRRQQKENVNKEKDIIN